MTGATRTRARSYLIFVARAAALVAVLALLWPLLAPRYSRLIAGLAEVGFEARGMIVAITIDDAGNLQADELTIVRGRPTRVKSRLALRASWEGLILLLALLLATPGLPWRGRLWRLALALALIAGYHTLYAVSYFSHALGHRVPIALWYPFSEVWVPVLIWAALTFSVFFSRPQKAVATAAKRSRQPA